MTDTKAQEEIVVPRAEAHGHWSVFLPAIIVALLYALIWAFLKLSGNGDGALGRLIFLVFVIAPPLLIVQAFLRHQSIGLALTKAHVLVVRGWPRMAGRQLALDDIVALDVKSGVIGQRIGVGGVIFLLRNGQRVRISDIANPEIIAGKIRQAIPLPTSNGV